MRKIWHVLLLMSVCLSVPGLAQDAGFEGSAKLFLNEYCVKCHGAEKPKGGVTLNNLLPVFNEPVSVERWLRVLEQVQLQEMPPEEAKTPPAAQREAFVQSLNARLNDAGHRLDLEHKLAQPAYGNLVSHTKLFDGSIKGPVASAPRLWRVHPEIYLTFKEQLFRAPGSQPAFSQPFVLASMPGVFQGYASGHVVDDARLTMLLTNSEMFTQWQTIGWTRTVNTKPPQPPRTEQERGNQKPIRAVVDDPNPATREQLAAAIAFQFDYVLNRQPTPEETERFVSLAERAIALGGKGRGLAVALTAVLLQPEAVFRMELGLGPADEYGRRILSPHELSHAIAYALTDEKPDAELRKAVQTGRLMNRSDVEREVRRILNDEKKAKPRILRFFREFFGYDNAKLVFKGNRVGTDFAPGIFVRDCDQLILRILEDDKQVLRELLTTDQYCVLSLEGKKQYDSTMKYIDDRLEGNKENVRYFTAARQAGRKPIPEANPAWRKTVRYYNLNEETLDWQERIPLTGQRAGILTHPAWLVAWSGNFDNDPIRRGKWIREHLLAGSVPEVPITVNAVVPDDPHKTLRERLTVTRQEYCWQCHSRMDGLGYAFEGFDDLGRHRSEELLADKTKRPADSRGQILASGEPALDGDVKDVFELTQKLAASERVRQSFVRYVFRFWMGRNERLADSPVLMAADKAYTQSNGSFKELVVSLLTSDAFLYRK